MEISLGTLSSSFTTEGEKIDLKWFDKIKSVFGGLFNLFGKTPIGHLLKNLEEIKDPVKTIADAINRIKGLFGKAKAKLEEAKGVLIKIKNNPEGWIAGGLAVLAAVGAVGLSMLTGVSVTDMMTSVLNFGELAYSFDINISDKKLEEEIKEIIKNLYGPAGDLIGRGIAQLITGGLTMAPKVIVNVKAIALSWIANPDAREELLSAVSSLAWSGIEAAKQILFKFAFLKGRHALKAWYKVQPENIKKLVPKKIRDNIETWGNEGKEPWILEAKVEEKIEKWDAPDYLKEGLQEGLSGFWEQVRTSLEYRYV